jgi:NAD+ kinase
MKILCTGNKSKEDFYPFLLNLLKYFSEYSHDFFIDEFVRSDEDLYNISYDSIYKSNNNFDFVISIGGDGALLSAIRRMREVQLPILGIHIGTLGFLNIANKKNYLEIVESIFLNKVHYREKTLISAIFKNDDSINKTFYAFNEIYINQSNISRLISLEVNIDGVELNKYKCDGLIISTPTGSTAYSLSAGGPIVTDSINGFILNPVSPHSLSTRSIVVSDKSNIEIRLIGSNKEITVCADGQKSGLLFNNSKIFITKSKFFAKIIETSKDFPYFTRLQNQLGWNR